MILGVLVMVSSGVALWYVRQTLITLKALIYVHIRILLGWAQVLSLLSGVLDIVYPDRARTALGAAALFRGRSAWIRSSGLFGVDMVRQMVYGCLRYTCYALVAHRPSLRVVHTPAT